MIKKYIRKLIHNLPLKLKLILIKSISEELSDFSNFYEFDETRKITSPVGKIHSEKWFNFISSNCDLNDKNFFDIGCGDLILFQKMVENGKLKKYYAHDINQSSIDNGKKFFRKENINTEILKTNVSTEFNFDTIKNGEIDIAFSHSLCSHLNINSIITLLNNLRPKMKDNGVYLCSFIILPDKYEGISLPKFYLWENLDDGVHREKYSLKTYFHKDPYHYSISIIKEVFELTGWKYEKMSNYGHEFQTMIFLSLK